MGYIMTEKDLELRKERIVAEYDLSEVFYAHVSGKLYIIKRGAFKHE